MPRNSGCIREHEVVIYDHRWLAFINACSEITNLDAEPIGTMTYPKFCKALDQIVGPEDKKSINDG